MRTRDRCLRVILALSLAVTLGCKEEQTGVRVADLSFEGNKAVSDKQLRSVLATGESSKLPWGAKRYFSRQQFEADLKRIEAFYVDRGFPEARVKSFDAKLNDKQTAVNLSIVIAEGEPIRVERITFTGFEALPAEHMQTLSARLALKEGQPLDRAQVQASREVALDELRDHGYPYATVQVREAAGGGPRADDHSVSGGGRTGRVFRPDSNCRQLVGRRVDHPPPALVPARPALRAEQAAREPAAPLRARALPVRQRRTGRSRRAFVRDCHARDGDRRQAPPRQLQRRLRHGGKSPRRSRLAPRELFRRGADRWRARPLLVPRSRREAEFQSAVHLQPLLLARRHRPGVVHRRTSRTT